MLVVLTQKALQVISDGMCIGLIKILKTFDATLLKPSFICLFWLSFEEEDRRVGFLGCCIIRFCYNYTFYLI